ncbi:Kelch repeat-containing protein [Thalassolituus oleivorans]|uniref:Kelch repeat-containing protein n=1 Tax=Thalassolituus oleivorans TaxID=187493 RepID=UPI0024096DF3|nr:kelch repeat-containing protein [Thalassolituus oleivorans]MDF1641395.1 hypothetical protein [Thalassolituus oleivorans]
MKTFSRFISLIFFIPSLSLAQFSEDRNFSMEAWIGHDSTDISFSTEAEGLDFSRSSDRHCDSDDILNCADGQIDEINGNPITDTTLKVDQAAVYKIGKGSSNVEFEVSNHIFNIGTSSQAIVFKNRFWFIGNQIWSSADGLNWIFETDEAEFSSRTSHQIILFKEKLWLIGGTGGATKKKDIWSSEDGIHWSEENSNAPFGSRDSHRLAVLNDKLYLVGGEDDSRNLKTDVWSSVNGIDWVEETATAGFDPRYGFSLTEFNNKLFVIGGKKDANTVLNDVWSSADGVQWTEDASITAFSKRYVHETVAFNDKLWLIGGTQSNRFDDICDVWSSDDGVLWIEETPNTGIYYCSGNQAVTLNNELYLIGGYNSDSLRSTNGTWHSEDGINWQKKTQATHFSPRSGHQSIVFNNKVWVIGGTDNELRNDIWSTTDGLSWTQETAEAEFSPRYSHQVAIFDEKLWLIGGYGSSGFLADVWSSTDGVEWALVTADAGFKKRFRHDVVTYQDKLYVIGGYTGSTMNDVWSSVNGIDWTEETSSAGFSTRTDLRAAVFDGKIWVVGGRDGRPRNDVWSSTDGTNWTLEKEQAAFDGRSQHELLVFNSRLWLIAGMPDIFGDDPSNDVWWTDDGINWQPTTDDAEFSPRNLHQALVFNDEMWVLGGFADALENDVWKSSDGKYWALAHKQNFNLTVEYSDITTSSGYNGSISPEGDRIANGLQAEFTLTPDAGFGILNVTGCNGSLEGRLYTTAALTNDCQIQASFTPQYEVTVIAGSHGEISPNTTQFINHGNTASFVISPNTGYKILAVTGCSGTLADGIYTTAAITNSCSVAATFELQEFQVSLNVGTGGIVSPSETQTLTYGSSTSFTVTPDEGFNIKSVSGCSGELDNSTYRIPSTVNNCVVSVSFEAKDTEDAPQNNDDADNNSGEGSSDSSGGGSIDLFFVLIGLLMLISERRLRYRLV